VPSGIRHQGQSPEAITLDGYAASHRAVREMKADGLLPEDTKVRSPKYPNTLIEQDHRHIKSRTDVMLGFKRFRIAATTISGIELTHRIRKGQFDLAQLGLKDTAAPAVWNAVLSDRYGILSIGNLSIGLPICARIQATMFFLDPSGNAVEFKAFTNMASLFVK